MCETNFKKSEEPFFLFLGYLDYLLSPEENTVFALLDFQAWKGTENKAALLLWEQKKTIELLSFTQMEDVCVSADRRHISFLRTANIAQGGTLKLCLLSLISPHLEQNTWPWRELGPLTCGPATGHISKYQTKMFLAGFGVHALSSI